MLRVTNSSVLLMSFLSVRVCRQAGLDKSVLMSFIQLRADFKTAKLTNIFR